MTPPDTASPWPRFAPSIDRYGRWHCTRTRKPARYAADLDDAERHVLRAVDARAEAHVLRVLPLIFAPPLVLVALHPFVAIPVPAALCVIYGVAVGIGLCLRLWARCPNCAQQPQRCDAFCPTCGERALEPGLWLIPTCNACGKVMDRYRGMRRYWCRYCSTCGLALGRREAQHDIDAPP
ncbi:MAG TPA: hypothetical protein VJ724_14945 [Tahibacter sp.]|nr:hypothetical protein [Tahibacter sp.]